MPGDRYWRWRIWRWRHQPRTRPLQLPPEFAPCIGNKTHVRVLDLGAGAVPCIGRAWPTATVEMVRADNRARDYRALWRLHDRDTAEPIDEQHMEALTYPDASFDIVYCSNALDHCTNPKRALEEMWRVTKSDGWVYLRHREYEGLRNHYAAEHQWDLVLVADGKDCRISSPEDEGFLLSQVWPGLESYKARADGYWWVHTRGPK